MFFWSRGPYGGVRRSGGFRLSAAQSISKRRNASSAPSHRPARWHSSAASRSALSRQCRFHARRMHTGPDHVRNSGYDHSHQEEFQPFLMTRTRDGQGNVIYFRSVTIMATVRRKRDDRVGRSRRRSPTPGHTWPPDGASGAGTGRRRQSPSHSSCLHPLSCRPNRTAGSGRTPTRPAVSCGIGPAEGRQRPICRCLRRQIHSATRTRQPQETRISSC